MSKLYGPRNKHKNKPRNDHEKGHSKKKSTFFNFTNFDGEFFLINIKKTKTCSYPKHNDVTKALTDHLAINERFAV